MPWFKDKIIEYSGDDDYHNEGSPSYTPEKCSPGRHLSRVQVGGRDTDKNGRLIKHYTCQSCGSNWDEDA